MKTYVVECTDGSLKYIKATDITDCREKAVDQGLDVSVIRHPQPPYDPHGFKSEDLK